MVHSDVRGCLHVAGGTVAEKFRTIEAGLAALSGTLVMPTFTYSFCRGVPFDVANSPSTVGALTEHFRKQANVRRTRDPIFSCAVLGDLPPQWERWLFQTWDVDCFGDQSIFNYLRNLNATFVFFGVGFEACTFVHHLEQRACVPYRYMKDFGGIIRDGSEEKQTWASYFARPLDGSVEYDLGALERRMLIDGSAHEVHLPNGPRLLVTNARSLDVTVRNGLRQDPQFLLRH